MEVARERCASCGEALSDPGIPCPACGHLSSQTVRPSRATLFIIIVFLILGFAVTGVVVRGHKARQQQLAQRWFARGERDLARGAPQQAVNEFQTALAYGRDNDAFRLKLALALMQSGQEDEARAHLVNLWEARPGDSNVNLQLARVMARLGHSEEAVRYYHGAIYGVWDDNPLEKRQAARFELAQYLLQSRQFNAAESELIALAAESPSSRVSEIRLGDMFMQAGDPGRALSAYLHARKSQHDATADLGAARAAFALHRLREAREYAHDAYRGDPRLEEALQLEKQADSILRADPQLAGLNSRDRAERTFAAYSSALARLNSCTATTSDPALQALVMTQETQFKRLSTTALRRDPDLLQQAVQWTYDVERASQSACGAPSGLDATLLTLAESQGAR